jgi:hypothetical protein
MNLSSPVFFDKHYYTLFSPHNQNMSFSLFDTRNKRL